MKRLVRSSYPSSSPLMSRVLSEQLGFGPWRQCCKSGTSTPSLSSLLPPMVVRLMSSSLLSTASSDAIIIQQNDAKTASKSFSSFSSPSSSLWSLFQRQQNIGQREKGREKIEILFGKFGIPTKMTAKTCTTHHSYGKHENICKLSIVNKKFSLIPNGHSEWQPFYIFKRNFCSKNESNNDQVDNSNYDNIFNDETIGNQTKLCWKCDKPTSKTPNGSHQVQPESPRIEEIGTTTKVIVCCPHCGSIQPLSKDVDYFSLFNLNNDNNNNSNSNNTNQNGIKKKVGRSSRRRFDINLDELRKEYLRLQQNMHPDMNINLSNVETEYSASNSSIINEAYKTLRDPYQRALYILKSQYKIIIDEVNVDSEPELLLEIMELNEEIELATDKESIVALMGNVKETIEEIIKSLTKAFDEEKNSSYARKLTIKYSYYQTILEKLKSKVVSV